MAGCLLTCASQLSGASHRDFVQANILDRGPDNGQATGLRREDVDLIGALPHIAEETFNGVGRLNVPMHAWRERVKGEGLLFLFGQASHRLGIALPILGFEGHQLGHRLLFCRLLPDPYELSSHLSALSSGDGVQDITLLMRASSVGEGWPKRVPRQRTAVRHARQ